MNTPPDAMVEIGHGPSWTPVCRYGDLTPGRGVAALVAGEQVALFRDTDGGLYALANQDPVSGACVISRGLTGSRDGTPVVTSPMYKQTYDLRTGACLDEDTPAGTLRTWPVRTREPGRPRPARTRTLPEWRPEDPDFWAATGARTARRNLWLSVLTEHIGFSVWSMWSVLVLFLGPEYGIDPAGKFTLTAVPTALGAALRLPYTQAVTRFGGRNWTVVSGLLLLLPTALMALVLRPGVSYTTLLLTASVAGVGGGNFASSMANINLFYPRRLKGRALGINAGGGNLGVPAVQLAGLLVLATAGAGHPRLLPLCYLPLIVLATALAARRMDNLPTRGERVRLREVAGDRHTWLLCLLYLGTFGSFIGFSFAFGQVLQVQFHDRFDTPVKVACLSFLGPLLGSLVRPLGGAWADRFGGARVTACAFAAMAAAAGLILATARAQLPAAFFAGFLALFVLSGIGNGSTYRMIPALQRAGTLAAIRAGADPHTAEATERRRTNALIGLAGAVGALGGVLINLAFRQSFLTSGNGDGAYAAFLALYLLCALLTVTVYREGRLAARV
ncbi:nitrite reductase small subunit NirD [Streptomyces sp. NPDC052396]|uniref:nitrite reductase small subunit NirD n=1 Tax=Streptomyces sp. NPDC052396 TaxID=3365689 RepID=UPI0037CDC92C